MNQQRHSVEQIIGKLRWADVELGQGKKMPDVCKALQITEQMYCRWRKKYGGIAPETAKEMKALRRENTRLKKLVVNQALDMEILRDAANGNW
jgi:putative transposase